MLRASRILMESSWRETMTYSRYLTIATRYLHKGLSDDAQKKYLKFSEPGFEAQRAVVGGGNEKIEKVPNTFEKM